MSDRWAPIRQRAIEARDMVQFDNHKQGLPLILAALDSREFEVMALDPGDVMLRGTRAMCGEYYVAYDRTFSPERIAFALAHELVLQPHLRICLAISSVRTWRRASVFEQQHSTNTKVRL